MRRTTDTLLMALLAACTLCACGGGQAEQGEPAALADSLSTAATAASTDSASDTQWLGHEVATPHTASMMTPAASPGAAEDSTNAIADTGTNGQPMHALAVASTSATSTSAPGSPWTKIADEDHGFAFVGARTVRYGSGNRWTEKIVSGSGQCSNAFFGVDPAVGVRKLCQSAVWRTVAIEKGRFAVSGSQVVRYGAGSSWIEKSVTGGGSCTNAFFGGDPLVGTGKACEVVRDRFAHPGLLHTQLDLERMQSKVAGGVQPWADGWQKLLNNPRSSLGWRQPNPQPIVYRGRNPVHVENYAALYIDVAAAYALALRWNISHEDAYADKAIAILNAWSSTLTGIDGASDKFLASGIYGYQLANAAELLRGYSKWQAQDFQRLQAMMLRIFYPMNHDFLVRHNGTKIDHYWANWDLANMASMLAIGVLTDRPAIYNEAVEYFKHGQGNGAIDKVVWKLYPNGLGQVQESGRDQGHSVLDIALLGAFCQMAWSQGDDLFGYDGNRFLRGAEYVAQFNLGKEVPFTTYANSDVTQTQISDASRGDVRPIWELVYNHYVVLKGLSAPNVTAFAAKVRTEGGGGDYGGGGGFDQLGYGTLTFSLQ